MPATATARHPSGETITFTEADHSYIDSRGRRYTSGTGVVKRCFAPFNADKISAAMAARDGRDAAEIRAEWKAKGAAACRLGTRVHEICEDTLHGVPLRHAPESERERGLMTQGFMSATALLASCDILAVELILFSPRFLVAGTMDILLRRRDTGALVIADWKTNEKLRTEGYRGATGIGPAAELPDCEMSRYALQLSLYQRLLLHEGYTEPGAQIERWLIHLAPDRGDVIPAPYLRAESAEALLNVCTMTTGVPQ